MTEPQHPSPPAGSAAPGQVLATGLPGCLVRPWQAADKADLVLHADNRKVWRNLTALFPHPYTAADADFWIALVHQPSNNRHLAIEWQGRAVGGIGIIAGDDVHCRTGQLGYWLGEAHWGRGIATAAARAMVAHARAELSFARLEARVYAWNPASGRVLEKAGFAREAVLRRSVFKDGELIDSTLYAMVFDA